MNHQQATMQDLRKLSELMDSKFPLPFGWRIGWDGILGFIPGIGDLATNCISLYILVRGAYLGCPPSVVLRMGLNILVDNIVDLVPLLGNIFDIFWKSNSRNIALIDQYLSHPRETTVTSRIIVTIVLVFIAALLVGLGFLAFALVSWLWGLFQGSNWNT